MPHFKKLFPTGFIDESDLPEPKTVTIESVAVEDLQLPGASTKERRVVVSFVGAKKRMVLNKTNAKRIAKMHGKKTEDWTGKEVVLWFDPSVKFGRETVGGVRVKEGKK